MASQESEFKESGLAGFYSGKTMFDTVMVEFVRNNNGNIVRFNISKSVASSQTDTSLALNSLMKRETIDIVLSDKAFFSGRSLVVESTVDGKQNAEVWTKRGNILCKQTYLGYAFKDLFGGYWFAAKDVQRWKLENDFRMC